MNNEIYRIKELYNLAEDDEKIIAELYNLTREQENKLEQLQSTVDTQAKELEKLKFKEDVTDKTLAKTLKELSELQGKLDKAVEHLIWAVGYILPLKRTISSCGTRNRLTEAEQFLSELSKEEL